jgi:hypothetical protein
MPTRRPGAARLAVLTATATIAALLTATATPGWTRAAGLDVWNLPTLEREFKAGIEMSRRLDGELEYVLRRQGVKEGLVTDLVAGRATLAEVVTDFVELDRGQPWFPDAILADRPGHSDREAVARNVVGFALNRVTNPGEREEVRRRLERELQEFLTDPAAPARIE